LRGSLKQLRERQQNAALVGAGGAHDPDLAKERIWTERLRIPPSVALLDDQAFATFGRLAFEQILEYFIRAVFVGVEHLRDLAAVVGKECLRTARTDLFDDRRTTVITRPAVGPGGVTMAAAYEREAD
jgi:hypothetical protein